MVDNMTKEEFLKKFTQAELDSLIKRAFSLLKKNKGSKITYKSNQVIQYAVDGMLDDSYTRVKVKVDYNNDYTNTPLSTELTESIFFEETLHTDSDGKIDTMPDLSPFDKVILRIAWRIWLQYINSMLR